MTRAELAFVLGLAGSISQKSAEALAGLLDPPVVHDEIVVIDAEVEVADLGGCEYTAVIGDGEITHIYCDD